MTSPTDTNPGFRNYAFISYSRRDEREANWLHKALEGFRIPTGLPPLPDGAKAPKHVRPLFRDKTDLEVQPRSFVEQIERELAASRFLIVVCSPNAARSRPDGSHYVDWEIRQFIQAHGADYAQAHILPVILAGDPGCGDPERECLPPALLELGPAFREHNFPLLKDLPADRRGQTEAREQCVIGCVAFLLGVARTTIYDRHLRAQRERMRNYLALAAGVALALAGLTGWAIVERSRAETERVHAETERNHAETARQVAEAEKTRADEQAQLAIQQRDLAEKQRNLSETTLNFVTGLFFSIDPEVAKEREVTVREILDKADVSLAQPKAIPFPMSEMCIRSVLAQAYGKLGLYPKALVQGQAALQVAETIPDFKGDPVIARLSNNVGFWMDNTGDSDGAAEMYAKAMSIYEARPEGADPVEFAQLLDNVGNCALRIGSYPEAREMMSRSLELRRESFPGDHMTVLQSLNNLGNLEMATGAYAKALPLFTEAVEMMVRLNAGSRESVTVARIEENIALCQVQQKRFPEALATAERAVSTLRRLFKEETRDIANAINNLGFCRAAAGHNEEALANYEEALAMARRVAPDNLALEASILDNEGAALTALKRYAEALEKQTEALGLRRSAYGEGEDHVDVAHSLHNMAATQVWMGRHEEARALWEQSLAMFDRVFQGDHPDKVQCLDCLASCLDHLGDREAAVRYRERCTAMRERLQKTGDVPTAQEDNKMPSQ